jgi:hypothetical protein
VLPRATGSSSAAAEPRRCRGAACCLISPSHSAHAVLHQINPHTPCQGIVDVPPQHVIQFVEGMWLRQAWGLLSPRVNSGQGLGHAHHAADRSTEASRGRVG